MEQGEDIRMLNNEDRQFIEQNIKDLFENIDSKKSSPMPLETDHDFMTLMCELMGGVDWLFQAACMFSNLNGLNKNQAIITGHLIRIQKLYRGMRIHASKDQVELAVVFHRLIFETAVYMFYLVQNEANPESYESFVVSSYMDDRELLFFLQEQSRRRELLNIEKRMLESITGSLKKDGISEDTLKYWKHKRVDGKTFKQMLEDIDFSNEIDGYSRGDGLYRSASTSIHPNWQHMSRYNLIYKEGRYFPHVDFCSVDIRVVGTISIICLGCLLTYIGLIEEWNATHLSTCENDLRLLENFKSAIEILLDFISELEMAHEETLG